MEAEDIAEKSLQTEHQDPAALRGGRQGPRPAPRLVLCDLRFTRTPSAQASTCPGGKPQPGHTVKQS